MRTAVDIVGFLRAGAGDSIFSKVASQGDKSEFKFV
jgi:hypothetical protein